MIFFFVKIVFCGEDGNGLDTNTLLMFSRGLFVVLKFNGEETDEMVKYVDLHDEVVVVVDVVVVVNGDAVVIGAVELTFASDTIDPSGLSLEKTKCVFGGGRTIVVFSVRTTGICSIL